MLTQRICTGFVLIVASGLLTGTAHGQNFPAKPIRIVTGDVGGTADIIARMAALGLSPGLGQQVIVENRGGANGGVATQTVSRATPDGYTLLLYASALWLAPLMGNVPWDPVKDFAPVSLVASAPNVLVVHPSVPAKSVRELVALAKSRPGALNYGSGGLGGSPHLAGELFKSLARVNIVRVAYKGTGPAVNDLVGGHVQLMFASAGALNTYVKSGRLRALAVTSLKPSALAPGLPTVAASGLPGFVTVGYYPLFAPVATPAPVIHRLQQETEQTVNKPELKERLISAGVEPVGGTPEELAALIKTEMSMWGKLFREAGIRE
jgi:tripartite-type tricarboxylate transporter receptor subunit TctC